MSPKPRPKALIFDLMGTCLDWRSSITPILRQSMQQTPTWNASDRYTLGNDVDKLALEWREGFFAEIDARFNRGMPLEDIDDTHRRVLVGLLREWRWEKYRRMSEAGVERCVSAWHEQKAWPDVINALPKLKREYDVVVLANGTMRLQIDITKSSGLDFDMLLSSELLKLTKPDPEIYLKAMSLLKREPEECIMVAAHAYDLRAAKKVGMRTVYLQRQTEDLIEDMEVVKSENDIFIDSREATAEAGGLLELVEMLQAMR